MIRPCPLAVIGILLLLTTSWTNAAAVRGATRATATAATTVQRDLQGKNNDNTDDNTDTDTDTTLSGLTLGDVFDFVQGETQGDGISPNAACAESRQYVDVIIIGAGMAGVAAAKTLTETDPTLTYVVLESTDRVGGRMRSVNFGISTNSRTVEDGANWLIQFNGNPVLAKATELGLVAPINDYDDVAGYYEDGMPIDPALITSDNERYLNAWDAATLAADEQWANDHESFPDGGVRALLEQNGWTTAGPGTGAQGNLDYCTEWSYLDWEYAARDTSVRFFPFYMEVVQHVNDQRGFEVVPQTIFQQEADPASLRTLTRVNKINYNENVGFEGKNYKVMVSATHEGAGTSAPPCTDYYAQRVISTVSAGVIANDLIEFNPPLAFPHQQNNPYYMTQYVKIFYQFDNQFWDDNEILRIVRDEQHRGHCHHWGNMNGPGFYPGSNMIRCEIMTEAFDELKDPISGDLTDDTLMTLLDPLRTAYGAENVPTPLDMYYPKLNKDRDFGFGAYANWKTGFTFTQFAHMYGGIPIVPYCEHNGCNDMGQWTMVFSGAHTCYDWAEFTHGAYFAGEKSARIVLTELGYTVDNTESPCDADSWVWLQ